MTPEQKEDPNFDCVGYWQGMIFGIQGTPCGQVMYSFIVKMPQNYPMEPPIVRFITKIVLPCVDSRGYVNVNRIPGFQWNPHLNLADVLMAIRDAMRSPECSTGSRSVVGQQYFTEYPPSQVERNFQ